jgi:hypothetical protein
VACAVVQAAVGLLDAGVGIIGIGYVIAFAAGIIVLLAKSAVQLVVVVSTACIIEDAVVNKALACAIIVNVYSALALIAVVSIAVLAMESGNVAVLFAIFSVSELNDNAGAVGTLYSMSTANTGLAVIFAAECAEGELAVIYVNSASVCRCYVDVLFTSGAVIILAGHTPMYAVLAFALSASRAGHGVPCAGIAGIVAMPCGRRIINNRRAAVIYHSAGRAVKLTVYNKVGIENKLAANHNVNGNVGRNYRQVRYVNAGGDSYVVGLGEILVACKICRELSGYCCKGCKRYYRQDHQSSKDKRKKFSFHDNLLQIFFRAPLIGALFVYCCFSRYDRTQKNEICSL